MASRLAFPEFAEFRLCVSLALFLLVGTGFRAEALSGFFFGLEITDDATTVGGFSRR